MPTYKVKGVDRDTGQPLQKFVEASDKDKAATSAGFLVESVKLHHEIPKMPELPEYAGLLLASNIIKKGSLILIPLFVVIQIFRWYFALYGDGMRAVEAGTTSGIISYILYTFSGVILLGLLYVVGDLIAAFRDIAINMRIQRDKNID
jgi:hypothetical protein